ncbi:MAG: hypothetical protein U5K43_06585 [Halofilum sp. (in: g-proteobacteria)]|nr:hypothetical protein [Halofilum sp. (in: g-proteobacteria)]
MAHRFFASIRPDDDGRVIASAHHTHYTPSRADDEQVLDRVACTSVAEAEALIADKARRRGFRWDQIEWDAPDAPE